MRTLLRTTWALAVLAGVAATLLPSSATAGGLHHKHCKHCGPGGYGYGAGKHGYGPYGYEGYGWHWSAYTTCVGNWCGFLYPSRPEPVWGPSWHGLYYPVGPAPGMTPYGYIAPGGGTDVLAGSAEPIGSQADFNASAAAAQRANGGAAALAQYQGPYSDAAMLFVSAPAGARVFVDGQAVTTLDATRPFLVPNLKAGEGRDVELRAEIDRDGKIVSQTKSLPVVAGESMTIVINLDAASPTPAPAVPTASKPKSASK